MLCTGVDIIETARIRRVIERWGDRFLKRVYTESELSHYGHRVPSLAMRFAAKEAVMKALGTGIRGMKWRDIEILAEPSGKPLVNLHGNTRDKALNLGLDNLAISLSDSREFAVAFVVGEIK